MLEKPVRPLYSQGLFEVFKQDCSLLPDLASSGHIEYKSAIYYPDSTLEGNTALDVCLHAHGSRDSALAENYVYVLSGSLILRNGDDPMLNFEPVVASVICATNHLSARPRTSVTGLGLVKWRSEPQNLPTDLTFVMTHSDYDIYSRSLQKFDVRYKASANDIEDDFLTQTFDSDSVEVGSILSVTGHISGYSTETQTIEVKVYSISVSGQGPPLQIDDDALPNPDIPLEPSNDGSNRDESTSPAGHADVDATAEAVQENVHIV
ncbi:hypothetical protein PCANC_13428 [Puccinia coronata f. sp. avenae]|uniref:Uncharacterized protein n=1 Tax=Puccinia coronata f. sp. avenae TaxID=200324 RepID=A0A2N5V2G6_9BASI|nr:hypothetical protein PCANC_13428 [Puccinia coronata f. sp. avenae]